ncbi:MAG: hypothetical protein WDW36_010285 [Sanguina aurantia]
MVQTTSNNGRPSLSDVAVTAIIGRLCESSAAASQPLSLPLSLYQDGRQPDPSAVGDYLRKLLQHPGSFLERYGALLLPGEWQLFLPLRADYEVDHYLSQYEEQQAWLLDPRHLPAHIKNRRLAYMQRLQAGKEYFSDEAMQLRAPLLYQQQISQAGSGPAGPPGGGCPQQQESEPEEPPAGGRGTQLSDWLMRCAQKAEVTRLTKEQQAEEDAQMSEEEEEGSEAGDEADQSGDMEDTGSGHLHSSQAAAGDSQDEQPVSPATGSALSAPASSRKEDTSCGSSGGGVHGQSSAPGVQALQAAAPQAGLHRPTGGPCVGAEAGTKCSSDTPAASPAGHPRRDISVPASETSSGRRQAVARPVSVGDIVQQRREFVMEMESRFLTGADAAFVDYAAIDSDSTLDNDWLDQAGRDAEEKYFDDD